MTLRDNNRRNTSPIHASDPDGTDNGMSLREIEGGIFLTRQPSKYMQEVVNTCGAKKHIIMGHCQVVSQ